MEFLKLTVLLIWMSLCSVCGAENFSKLENMISFVKTEVDMLSGTALAIVKDDEIVYQKYFGYSDIEANKKVNENTVFYMASVTKPYFALAFLLKEQDKKYSQNSTLGELFPGIDFNDVDAKKITARDLLTHTSGLNATPMEWTTAYTGLHNEAIRHKLISALELSQIKNAGEFAYSNVGYNIMSVWFDDHYKNSWQDVLKKSVLIPAEMTHTSTHISFAEKYHWELAKPYSYKYYSGKKAIYLEKNDQTMHAAGGLISTVNDQARFVIAQINQGKVNGNQVFPADLINESHEIQVKFGSGGYAWGWFVGDYLGYTKYSHTGGYPGASALVTFMPDEKLGVVVLNNEGGLKANYLSAIIADVAYSLLANQENIDSLIREKQNALIERVQSEVKKLEVNAEHRKKIPLNLTLNRAHYAGVYKHPLLGELQVKLEGKDGYIFQWGSLYSRAFFSEKRDTMQVDFKPGSYKDIEFIVESRGVKAIIYEGIRFEKE